MSLVGSLRGVQANPEPCNSNSNRVFIWEPCSQPCDASTVGELTKSASLLLAPPSDPLLPAHHLQDNYSSRPADESN
jgi:hypothetical protein